MLYGERARPRSSVLEPGVTRGPALRISRGGVEERAGRLEPFPDQGVSLAQTFASCLSNSQARCFSSASSFSWNGGLLLGHLARFSRLRIPSSNRDDSIEIFSKKISKNFAKTRLLR